MNKSSTQRICRHCSKLFVPDRRNRTRQQFCMEPECQKARKIMNQQRWLAKNSRYFSMLKHAKRVRA